MSVQLLHWVGIVSSLVVLGGSAWVAVAGVRFFYEYEVKGRRTYRG